MELILVEILKAILGDAVDNLCELIRVDVVNEPVRIDAVALVAPQPGEGHRVGVVVGRGEGKPLEDTGELAEVPNVVELS